MGLGAGSAIRKLATAQKRGMRNLTLTLCHMSGHAMRGDAMRGEDMSGQDMSHCGSRAQSILLGGPGELVRVRTLGCGSLEGTSRDGLLANAFPHQLNGGTW